MMLEHSEVVYNLPVAVYNSSSTEPLIINHKATGMLLCRIIPRVPYQGVLIHNKKQTMKFYEILIRCRILSFVQNIKISLDIIGGLDFYQGSKILV